MAVVRVSVYALGRAASSTGGGVREERRATREIDRRVDVADGWCVCVGVALAIARHRAPHARERHNEGDPAHLRAGADRVHGG